MFLEYIFSVFLASGLRHLFSTFNLPFLTLPFNIVMVLIFITIMPAQDSIDLVAELNQNYSSPNLSVSMDWFGALEGSVISMGQVYALNSFISSLIIIFSVGLYSPLLLLTSLLGAAIGCLFPITFLHPNNFSLVNTGLLGYNSLLSMSSISNVFLPHSIFSFLAGLVNTFLTVLLQRLLSFSMV